MAARFPWRKQPEFALHCTGTRKLSNLIQLVKSCDGLHEMDTNGAVRPVRMGGDGGGQRLFKTWFLPSPSDNASSRDKRVTQVHVRT